MKSLRNPPIYKIHGNKKPLGKGLYGRYFRFSKNSGIKVIGRGYSRLEKLAEQMTLIEDAKFETMLLKKVSSLKISPRWANFIIVSYKGRYYAGIKMQHIHGDTLYNLNPYLEPYQYFVDRLGRIVEKHLSSFTLRQYVSKRFSLKGVKNTDLHLNNILMTPKGFIKIVDFSRDRIKYKLNRIEKKRLSDFLY